MIADRGDVIEVKIYGHSFPIKQPQDEDEVDYIRELAAHVDNVMNKVRENTGTVSIANVAIMAALNIAKEMFDEKRRYAGTIQKLIEALEDTMAEPDLRKRQETEDYELYFNSEE